MPEWQPNMRASLKEFWETKYRSSTGRATYPSHTPTHRPTKNQYFQWLNAQDDDLLDTATVNELELYLSNRYIPRPEDAKRTVLEWWLDPEQRGRYPLLSKMAIDIYFIPAMSSEPERVFSGAKRTISDDKGNLQSETIELLECMKSWFKLGIFTKEDLHAIVATMEEGAKEALEEDLE